MFYCALQLVEIVFDLLFIQLRRKTAEVKCDGCNVPAVVIKGSFASVQDGYIALKTLQQLLKSINFTAGTVEVFVVP